MLIVTGKKTIYWTLFGILIDVVICKTQNDAFAFNI